MATAARGRRADASGVRVSHVDEAEKQKIKCYRYSYPFAGAVRDPSGDLGEVHDSRSNGNRQGKYRKPRPAKRNRGRHRDISSGCRWSDGFNSAVTRSQVTAW